MLEKLVIAILGLVIGVAYAQSPSEVQSTTEDHIKQTISEIIPPGLDIKVNRTEFPEIFEVIVGKQIVYTNKDASFLFNGGELINIATGENLTERTQTALNSVKWDSLPLEYGLKEVKGNGKHKLAIFSDPDCPFCKRYEGDVVPKLTDITIYILPIPFEGIHPGSTSKTRAVLCQPEEERLRAWKDTLMKRKTPTSNTTCDHADAKIKAIRDYAENVLNIRGTPTLVFADGRVVPGAISIEQTLGILAQQESTSTP